MRPLKALISKSTLHRAHAHKAELYLVNPFNEYYDFLHDNYEDKEISKHGIFIVDKDAIIEMAKNKNNKWISRYINIYPLTGFNEKMLSDLKKDLEDIDYTQNAIDLIEIEYGITEIDIDDLL